MVETIKLGGREYSLEQKSLRQASVMRKRLNEQVEPLVKLARTAPNIEIKNMDQVGELLDELRGLLFNSVELLFEMLCEYEPEISKDCEWLLDHAIDEEVIEAALVMVKQLFPFGKALGTLSGLAENMTSTNLPNSTGKGTQR